MAGCYQRLHNAAVRRSAVGCQHDAVAIPGTVRRSYRRRLLPLSPWLAEPSRKIAASRKLRPPHMSVMLISSERGVAQLLWMGAATPAP